MRGPIALKTVIPGLKDALRLAGFVS